MAHLKKISIALPDASNFMNHWKALMFTIGVILLLWSASALSETSERDPDAPFTFGDSCELLDQLDADQLQSLTDYSNQGFWRDFCRINNSENCDQYSYLFEDIGELRWVQDNDGMCQFIRRHTMQDDGPTLFPNFGSYFPPEDFGPYFPMEHFGLNPPQ